jgi:GntR family transcriptional repressor for pyruvate dehydrogenase complex
MLRPVGKQRVAEEIVHQLRGLILNGSYSPGQKLPPERRLAEELGVNRASLREAIKSLEQMGLVKTRQGDGTRVLDFMQTAGVELVSHLIANYQDGGQPNLEVLADVLEFRRLFGREVARLAAERSTPEEVRKLEQIAERASAPQLDAEEVLKLDFEFYFAMTQAGRNRVLQLLINTIRIAVVSYAGFFVGFNPPPLVVRKHHRDLLKALAARESEKAAQIADAYLKRGAEQLLAQLKPPS